MISTLAWLGLLAAISGPRDGATVVALRYDRALAEADFPSPAARLTINGQTAWFLFDTGAAVHTVASWFAEAARLQPDAALDGAAEGVDSTGRATALRGVSGVQGLLENGERLSLGTVWVTTFPPGFEQSRVGGLLSPQLLAPPGNAVLLDLRVPELRIGTLDAALRRLEVKALPAGKVQFCGSRSDSVPNLAYAISTAAEGREGFLTLDTGAGATTISAASALVHDTALEAGGDALGVSGEARAYSIARGLRLSFAGFSAIVDARITEKGGGACGRDGLLGLDALAACALLMTDHDLAVRCRR